MSPRGLLAIPLALLVGVPGVGAAELRVGPAAPEGALQEAVARAAAGDTIVVGPGSYRGPLEVARSVRLVGEEWPVIDGGEQGTVVALRAAGASIEGFVVRASGASLDQENAGITVDEAPGAEVIGNRLEDVLFGIYVRRSPGAVVRGNRIAGKPLPLPRRGDAVRVWHSDGTAVEGNEIDSSRDVVLWYSSGLTVRDNRVRAGRYGLHFMYCDDAVIEGNLLLDNSVGAFLMYSRRLRLVRNAIAGNHGPSGYGVGLKDMDDALVEENLLAGNRVGAFLDNSPREIDGTSDLRGNLFAANDSGVVLMPNVRRARFEGNSFVENGEQMTVGGPGGDPDANLWRENYWSDYGGYDADGDGRGDVPYRAEKLFESLSDRRPELRLMRNGPATHALEMAARAFPLVRPQPKLVDERPRMAAARPGSVPALPDPGGRGWMPVNLGLVAAAGLLLAAPRRRRRAEDRGGPAPRSESPAAGTIIEARGLARRFGPVEALAGIDFSVRAGESVALWGPNGAGKTTALRALLGIIAYEGRLEVAGMSPRRQGKRVRRQIGFVPQETALDGGLTVGETLSFFARLRGAPEARAEELLAWLALGDHLDRRVGGLSGGLRQRLALGLALLDDPPILLLDEPTANLDVAARAALYRLLLELRGRGKTLVFTSHRIEEVLALADRVLHLEGGRLVESGPPARLSLDGGAPAELRLLVAEPGRERAAELLAAAGFTVRGLGPYLLMTVAPGRRVEPLELLLGAGIDVEDLELGPRIGIGGAGG